MNHYLNARTHTLSWTYPVILNIWRTSCSIVMKLGNQSSMKHHEVSLQIVWISNSPVILQKWLTILFWKKKNARDIERSGWGPKGAFLRDPKDHCFRLFFYFSFFILKIVGHFLNRSCVRGGSYIGFIEFEKQGKFTSFFFSIQFF